MKMLYFEEQNKRIMMGMSMTYSWDCDWNGKKGIC